MKDGVKKLNEAEGIFVVMKPNRVLLVVAQKVK